MHADKQSQNDGKAPECILSEVVSGADDDINDASSDLEEVANDVMSSVFEGKPRFRRST